MESFATEEEAHADGRYELEKINPSLEVVTGKAWPRAEGKEMIATSHGRQSWKDNPKAKDDCGDGLVTVDRRFDRGPRLRASIYPVKLP
jgi:hypothetical protein